MKISLNLSVVTSLVFTLAGCNKTSDNNKWVIKTPPPYFDDSYIIPYHARVQRINLTTTEPNQIVILITPFTSNDTLKSPENIFNTITNLNDSTRLKVRNRYWYVFEINNITPYNKWVLVESKPGTNPELYRQPSRYSDSLVRIKPIIGRWRGRKNVNEIIFPFEFNKNGEIKLLFSIESNEAAFVDKITIYPYEESVQKPLSNDFWNGIEVSVLAVILLVIFLVEITASD